MRSLLQQIDQDGFVLLMYLSDELPAGDRAKVEQRLAREPGLREQLEMLRGQETALEIAAAAEVGGAGIALESAVQKRALRAVRQWALTHGTGEPATAGRRGLGLHSLQLHGLHLGGTWMRIGISVAAGVLLSVTAWQIIGHRSGGPGNSAVQPGPVARTEEVSTQDQLAVMSGTLDASPVDIASDQKLVSVASGSSSSVEDVVADVSETPNN